MALDLRRAIWMLFGTTLACSRGSNRAVPEATASSISSASNNVSAAPVPATRVKVTVEAQAMGTRVVFVALTSARSDETATRATIDRAIAEVRRLEALMTTWRD